MEAWWICIVAVALLASNGDGAVTSATWSVRPSSAGFCTIPDPSNDWAYAYPADELSVNAYFDVRFDQDAYMLGPDCTEVRYCNEPVVAPCCVSCDENNRPNPLPDPSNSANCICPSYPNTYCLDPSTPFLNFPGAVWNSVTQFEVGILSNCTNILITLRVASGDCDLYINSGEPADPLDASFIWTSQNFGSDAMWFCADRNAGNPKYFVPNVLSLFTDSNAVTNKTSRLFVSSFAPISGVDGFGMFSMTVVESQSTLLPLTQYYWMLNRTITCGSTVCFGDDGNFAIIYYFDQYPCKINPCPPSDDPCNTWGNSEAGGIVVDWSAMHGDRYVAYFPLYDLYGVLLQMNTYNGSIASCVLDGRPFLTANRSRLAPDQIAFTPAVPSCDQAMLAELLANISATVHRLDNASAESASDNFAFIFRTGGYEFSDAWWGCINYIDQLLGMDANASVGGTNTTLCYVPPTSPYWIDDPCCNPALWMVQCCNPRNASYLLAQRVPDMSKLEQECRTPECAAIALSSLQQENANHHDVYIEGCHRQVNDFLDSRPWIANNPSSSCAVQFAGNESGIAQCVFVNSDPAVKAQLVAAWGLAATISDVELEDNFNEHFLLTGCVQYASDISTWESGLTQAQCTSLIDCNWAAGRDNASCLNDGGLNQPNMCAVCDSHSRCTEMSVFAACRNPYQWDSSVEIDIACTRDGNYWDSYLSSCVLNSTTLAACLPSQWCAPGSNICTPKCAINLTQAECGPGMVPANNPLSLYANFLSWEPVLGLCLRAQSTSTVVFPSVQDCNSIGGTIGYFPGAEWSEPSMDTPASCTVGICADAQGLNQSQCTSSFCIVDGEPFLSMTQPQCQSHGWCTDEELGTGACIYPYVPNTANTDFGSAGIPLCSETTYTPLSIGCSNPAIDSSLSCKKAGGTWMTRAVTDTDCLARVMCSEQPPTLNGQEVSSYKSPAQCIACGGASMPVYEWQTGQWIRGSTWTATTWTARKMDNVDYFGQYFDQPSWDALYGMFATNILQLSQRMRTVCVFNEVAANMQLLLCDCVNREDGCFDEVSGISLGLAQLCSAAPSVTSFAGSAVISTNVSMVVSTGCSEITVTEFPWALYARPSSSFYSNPFVKSIQQNQFSVITNSHGIAVGQLLGNAIGLNFSVLISDFQLCVALDPSIPVSSEFDVLDFGATTNGDFTSSSIVVLGLPVELVVNEDVTYLCGNVNESLTYFPIARRGDWRSAQFYDTLSKSQRAALVASTVIYFLVWAAVMIRLIDTALSTIYLQTNKHRIMKRRAASTKSTLSLATFGLLGASLLLRWIYFLLIVTGSATSLPKIVDILFAELPTYFFFTLFLVLVHWCVVFVYFVATGDQQQRYVKWGLIAACAVMYLLLLIVIIIYVSVDSNRSRTAACSAQGGALKSKTPETVAKVYRCIVAAMAALISAAFIVFGTRVLLTLQSTSMAEKRPFVFFMAMTYTTCVGLLLQCVLLLYSTFASSGLSTQVACTLSILFELVPAIVMVAVIRQVPIPGRRSVLWCLHDPHGNVGMSTLDSTTESRVAGSTSNGHASGTTSGTASGLSGAASSSMND